MKGGEFTKVDRALEMRVIDWLQWSQFPEDIGKRPDDSDMAQLALILINKRKKAYQKAVGALETIIQEPWSLGGDAPKSSVDIAKQTLKELGELQDPCK